MQQLQQLKSVTVGPIKVNSPAHLPVQKTTIKTFQVWLSDHLDVSLVRKAAVWEIQGSCSQLITFIINSVCHTLSQVTVISVVCAGYRTPFIIQRIYRKIQINQLTLFCFWKVNFLLCLKCVGGFWAVFQGAPKPVAMEPCSGGKAAVLTVLMRLPSGPSGLPPPGQSG